MTQTQKIAYTFIAQTVVLLLLYAAAALLAGVKFLSPDDPLALSLPYHLVGGLANLLLNLAALTGLAGGGVYAAALSLPDARLPNEALLNVLLRVWAALLAVSVIGGMLGFLDGRNLLELPSIAALLFGMVLALLVAAVVSGAARVPVVQVWGVGMALALVSLLVSLLSPADYLQDRLLRALALALRLNIAYPITAAALGFWLMQRFSSVARAWADTGVYTVAGVLALAGTLVSLPLFYQAGAAEWADTIGRIGVIAAPLLYLIFAGHSYAALSVRSSRPALSAHWYSLSLLLFLLGPGLLGGLSAAPGVAQWTAGTRLSDLQSTLTLLAVVSMTLGVTNEAAADLWGKNRRVTGLTPFWLAAFGMVGGGLALAAAGVAQVYLERVLSVGYLDTQTLIAPLYALWVVGLLLLAAGLAIYALAFWQRRPAEPVA